MWVGNFVHLPRASDNLRGLIQLHDDKAEPRRGSRCEKREIERRTSCEVQAPKFPMR